MVEAWNVSGSLQLHPLAPRTSAARACSLRPVALLLFATMPACSRDDSNVAPASPGSESPESPTMLEPPPTAQGVDEDRVVKLYADAPGVTFRLGDADPNDDIGLSIEEGTHATLGQEGGISFWSVDTYDFEYSEGGVPGKTARFHISSAGATQRFDWHDQRGYLAGPEDLGDQELTAFVRVHGIFDPEHAAFELKVRGGQHSDDAPTLASCTMMTFATSDAPGVSRFGKELNHPEYDFVNLPPRYHTQLLENRWYGLKLVTFVDPLDRARVINRLYVDDDPFQPDGSPRNAFRLLTEYVDRSGTSTGLYDTLVNWRGFVTTLRVDGVESVDVARLSARAIHG